MVCFTGPQVNDQPGVTPRPSLAPHSHANTPPPSGQKTQIINLTGFPARLHSAKGFWDWTSPLVGVAAIISLRLWTLSTMSLYRWRLQTLRLLWLLSFLHCECLFVSTTTSYQILYRYSNFDLTSEQIPLKALNSYQWFYFFMIKL